MNTALRLIPYVIILLGVVVIFGKLALDLRRINRAHVYRMKMLAFAQAGKDSNERVFRLLWVFLQPGLDDFCKHKGDYDELLVGPLAADFAAWNAINSK